MFKKLFSLLFILFVLLQNSCSSVSTLEDQKCYGVDSTNKSCFATCNGYLSTELRPNWCYQTYCQQNSANYGTWCSQSTNTQYVSLATNTTEAAYNEGRANTNVSGGIGWYEASLGLGFSDNKYNSSNSLYSYNNLGNITSNLNSIYTEYNGKYGSTANGNLTSLVDNNISHLLASKTSNGVSIDGSGLSIGVIGYDVGRQFFDIQSKDALGYTLSFDTFNAIKESSVTSYNAINVGSNGLIIAQDIETSPSTLSAQFDGIKGLSDLITSGSSDRDMANSSTYSTFISDNIGENNYSLEFNGQNATSYVAAMISDVYNGNGKLDNLSKTGKDVLNGVATSTNTYSIYDGLKLQGVAVGAKVNSYNAFTGFFAVSTNASTSLNSIYGGSNHYDLSIQGIVDGLNYSRSHDHVATFVTPNYGISGINNGLIRDGYYSNTYTTSAGSFMNYNSGIPLNSTGYSLSSLFSNYYTNSSSSSGTLNSDRMYGGMFNYYTLMQSDFNSISSGALNYINHKTGTNFDNILVLSTGISDFTNTGLSFYDSSFYYVNSSGGLSISSVNPGTGYTNVAVENFLNPTYGDVLIDSTVGGVGFSYSPVNDVFDSTKNLAFTYSNSSDEIAYAKESYYGSFQGNIYQKIKSTLNYSVTSANYRNSYLNNFIFANAIEGGHIISGAYQAGALKYNTLFMSVDDTNRVLQYNNQRWGSISNELKNLSFFDFNLDSNLSGDEIKNYDYNSTYPILTNVNYNTIIPSSLLFKTGLYLPNDNTTISTTSSSTSNSVDDRLSSKTIYFYKDIDSDGVIESSDSMLNKITIYGKYSGDFNQNVIDKKIYTYTYKIDGTNTATAYFYNDGNLLSDGHYLKKDGSTGYVLNDYDIFKTTNINGTINDIDKYKDSGHYVRDDNGTITLGGLKYSFVGADGIIEDYEKYYDTNNDGVISSEEKLYRDVNGNGVIDNIEKYNDLNNNGVIDDSEAISTNFISANNFRTNNIRTDNFRINPITVIIAQNGLNFYGSVANNTSAVINNFSNAITPITDGNGEIYFNYKNPTSSSSSDYYFTKTAISGGDGFVPIYQYDGVYFTDSGTGGTANVFGSTDTVYSSATLRASSYSTTVPYFITSANFYRPSFDTSVESASTLNQKIYGYLNPSYTDPGQFAAAKLSASVTLLMQMFPYAKVNTLSDEMFSSAKKFYGSNYIYSLTDTYATTGSSSTITSNLNTYKIEKYDIFDTVTNFKASTTLSDNSASTADNLYVLNKLNKVDTFGYISGNNYNSIDPSSLIMYDKSYFDPRTNSLYSKLYNVSTNAMDYSTVNTFEYTKVGSSLSDYTIINPTTATGLSLSGYTALYNSAFNSKMPGDAYTSTHYDLTHIYCSVAGANCNSFIFQKLLNADSSYTSSIGNSTSITWTDGNSYTDGQTLTSVSGNLKTIITFNNDKISFISNSNYSLDLVDINIKVIDNKGTSNLSDDTFTSKDYVFWKSDVFFDLNTSLYQFNEDNNSGGSNYVLKFKTLDSEINNGIVPYSYDYRGYDTVYSDSSGNYLLPYDPNSDLYGSYSDAIYVCRSGEICDYTKYQLYGGYVIDSGSANFGSGSAISSLEELFKYAPEKFVNASSNIYGQGVLDLQKTVENLNYQYTSLPIGYDVPVSDPTSKQAIQDYIAKYSSELNSHMLISTILSNSSSYSTFSSEFGSFGSSSGLFSALNSFTYATQAGLKNLDLVSNVSYQSENSYMMSSMMGLGMYSTPDYNNRNIVNNNKTKAYMSIATISSNNSQFFSKDGRIANLNPSAQLNSDKNLNRFGFFDMNNLSFAGGFSTMNIDHKLNDQFSVSFAAIAGDQNRFSLAYNSIDSVKFINDGSNSLYNTRQGVFSNPYYRMLGFLGDVYSVSSKDLKTGLIYRISYMNSDSVAMNSGVATSYMGFSNSYYSGNNLYEAEIMKRGKGNDFISLSAGQLSENTSFMGSTYSSYFSLNGGITDYYDIKFSKSLLSDISLVGNYNHGTFKSNDASYAILSNFSDIRMEKMAIGLHKKSFFGGAVSMSYILPNVIKNGSANLFMITSYDPSTYATSYSNQRYELAPNVHEQDFEAIYGKTFKNNTSLNLSYMYRINPYNQSSLPNDQIFMLRFNKSF